MGLTIHCGDEEMDMGYAYVHRFRRALVEATIDYLSPESKSKRVKHEEERQENRSKAIKLLETWIAPGPSIDEFMKLAESTPIWEINLSPIRYECIHWPSGVARRSEAESPPELLALDLGGLYHWVAHADNEGFLSPGQARDIVTLLNKVVPHIEDDTHKQKCDELMTVCRESVASDTIIAFH